MNDTLEHKLEKCPRCHEDGYLRFSFSMTRNGATELRVKCNFCSYKGPLSSTKEGAAQLWNDDVLDIQDALRI